MFAELGMQLQPRIAATLPSWPEVLGYYQPSAKPAVPDARHGSPDGREPLRRLIESITSHIDHFQSYDRRRRLPRYARR